MNKKEIQSTLKSGENAIQFEYNNTICKVWYSLAFQKYKLTDPKITKDYEILLKGIEELLNDKNTINIKKEYMYILENEKFTILACLKDELEDGNKKEVIQLINKVLAF